MRNTRVPGHTLPFEGRLNNGKAIVANCDGSGASRCSCGKESPVLPSTNARKQWHREHKAAVSSDA